MLSVRLQSILFAFALLFGASAFAADLSPAGVWTTIDDATGEAKSIVVISIDNGVLTGTVREVLKSDQGPNPVCKECKGELKGKPVAGMRIIWDMKQSGDEWKGGQILDPKSGKVYGCKIHVIDGGQKLEVRGFKGFSLLGRTQVWHRRAE